MGGAFLEITINNIKTRVSFLDYNPDSPADGSISTLSIEHRSGSTRVYHDGEVVSEKYYTVEQVISNGLKIEFKAIACGEDCCASAGFGVDYIGIFEITPI
jgi:hypothetical protein